MADCKTCQEMRRIMRENAVKIRENAKRLRQSLKDRKK